MEKFLSIPLAKGGHKLISATGIYMVENSADESCVYVMYKDSNSIAKIYYIVEEAEDLTEEERKALEEQQDNPVSPGKADGILMAVAIENAIIHALQYSQGQVITTIHELPFLVDYVISYYVERLSDIPAKEGDFVKA
jgi:predicted alternative tryptophan synthase beta-subunit